VLSCAGWEPHLADLDVARAGMPILKLVLFVHGRLPVSADFVDNTDITSAMSMAGEAETIGVWA